MKQLLYLITTGFLLFSLFSCHQCDEDLNPQAGDFEYFVFGHFYGECGGEECVEIFRLDAEKLYEDTTDIYPGSQMAYDGQYIPLSNEKYELVNDITQFFPEELYDEENNVIGMPDAGDWGGVYVEIKYVDDASKSGFWLLDQASNNMPDVYNEFVIRINEKIYLINQ